MAVYRNVQTSFWTDSKVIDDFTPKDRLFYLYLFTNPHTNLCGCYEVSKKQISIEIGYTQTDVEKLLDRFEKKFKVIVYSGDTKEVLLINWHKYNWTQSKDFRRALEKEIKNIKHDDFRAYLQTVLDGHETVLPPSIDRQGDGGGTTVSVTVTDTVTVSDTVTDTVNNKKIYFGNNKRVSMTEDEYKKLIQEYGQEKTDKSIEYLDSYIVEKGYKTKSHYLTIRRWVISAVEDAEKKNRHVSKAAGELTDFYDMAHKWAEGS